MSLKNLVEIFTNIIGFRNIFTKKKKLLEKLLEISRLKISRNFY